MMRKHSTRTMLTGVLIAVSIASAGCRRGHHNTVAVPGAPSAKVPLFDDLGSHSHPITTSSTAAQKYFDQGLTLVFAFNPEEGKRAFEQAAKLDPKCAMAWWGIALALGPNINVSRIPDQDLEAVRAIRKARSLASRASESERAYIEALAMRYTDREGVDPRALDAAYAAAMAGLSRRFPEDLDAATLHAEALMDLRPWQLWTADGRPQPGTLEIVSILESVLERDPEHPGANHFYVHAVEASPHPERGLPAADRLKNLVPGAGHLVHMPFHIYMRTGRYDDAAKSNAEAVLVDRAYIEKHRPDGFYPMMYYPHNIHSLWASLCMEGRSAEALKAAADLDEVVPPRKAREMQMVEFFTTTPILALARFGKWDDILERPAPPADLKYLTGIGHYARGLAMTAKGRLEDAAREQASLETTAARIPADVMESLNSAAALLKIAVNVLAGELAAKQGRTDDAIGRLEEAVHDQDALNYDEPPGWYYPVRQSLGAVLLSAGRAAEAEKVYTRDLQLNPENGWSLFGLMKSLQAQNRAEEAAAIEERFRRAWARADVTLTSSRF